VEPLTDISFTVPVSPDLEEDKIWRQRVSPALGGVPANVLGICHYGFTEMVNNVIDHSDAGELFVEVKHSTAAITMNIFDDGVGIFNKIQNAFGLEDHRHAILDLAKGKLTTDPERHTGEGIFFTSRMFDTFFIRSGRLRFFHEEPHGDWLIEETEGVQGTRITLEIDPQSKRTTREVFDKFASSEDEYGFSRTHLFVSLAQHKEENLISRSQAKRLLARLDRFKEVFLDFTGIKTIGQAFADEIFRVFAHQNPHINLFWRNANDEVEKMIRRAMAVQNNSSSSGESA